MFPALIISVYFSYFKAMFLDKEGDYFLAGECLKGKMNEAYRLHQSDKTLRSLGFKVLKRSLLRFFGNRFKPGYSAFGEIGLIDETPANDNKERIDFIERVLVKKIKVYLAKEELMGYPLSLPNSIFLFFCLLLHGFFLVPLCFFSGKRVFHALAMYYIIESALALYYMKKAKIETVVFSNIYSQDSNINYLIFSKYGMQVIKNPSEDALAFDNSILLADKLIICNPYQIEEISYIKTIKVKAIVHGLPEQVDRFEGKYSDRFYQPDRKVVGYYSSGSWLRKQYSRLHSHMGVDCAVQEEQLLLELKHFIRENQGYSLKIFNHPVEKANQQAVNMTNSYFNETLGDVNYTLNDIDKHTCLSFEACDTAISLFSGSSLYRMVFGYKSLFYVPADSFPSFPFRNSSLASVNIGGQPDFNLFLKEQMNMDEREFFAVHHLEKYNYNTMRNKVGKVENIDRLTAIPA